MNETLHIVFGVSGNVFALLQFLAPLITFRRIVAKRGTENFSGIPYVMTLLNCLLFAWYGLPFVSPNNLLVSIISQIGVVIESIYIVLFLIYAPRNEKGKILVLLALVLTFFGTVAFVSMFAFYGDGRKMFCGIVADVLSIIMYASPLTIMWLVIRSNSVEFMPLFLSVFSFLCSTSRFIFGLLEKELFVAISNGSGTVLGAVQLILYAIYRQPKPKTPTSDGGNSEQN